MDFLAGLNPQQRSAVTHVEGPLLLLAGAGSGKTRVITHRIAHLVEAHRVPGPAILAVTFTNKASGEMRDRVLRLLGNPEHRSAPLVSTFHSFCVRTLRRDGARLADIRPGFTRQFNIYDDDDQVALIKQIFRNIGLDEKFMQYRAMSSWISHAKSHKQSPQDMYGSAKDPKTSRLAVVYERYEDRLRQANALDFDDLLLESVRLLQHDEDLRKQYGRRYEFLMIDEYQDTNRTQYELMRLLSEGHRNVCVVGDEDQSIYGWRGADIRNILDFERDYPNATVIRLEQNYRSTKNILEAASAVVAHNTERKGKWLWTDSGEGDKVGLYEALDGENEALFIADTVERILAANPTERVAVLYRTNFQSRQIEEALRRYGRKYLVVGGFSFYQRAEIRDLLSYLRALVTPHDSIALLRVINTPARGIGKTTIEQIEQFALANDLSLWSALRRMLDGSAPSLPQLGDVETEPPPLPSGLPNPAISSRAEAALRAFERLIVELTDLVNREPLDEILRQTIARTGYGRMLESDNDPESESRLANLNELVNAAAEAAERGETLTDFLDHAALVADSDDLDERAAVSLLTMHNAKGLEWPVVFIAGLEEGLFPHSRSLNSNAEMEEERRLCYVGMTRAQKRLILSWARYRRRFGGGQPEACVASRFLKEVPRERLAKLREDAAGGRHVDLFAERHEVRETVKKNLYTGKTYNSLDNIARYFSERGIAAPRPPATVTRPTAPAAQVPVKPTAPVAQAPRKKPLGPGASVNHPKYGHGMILRREGDGDDAKLTVSFPGYGLKKLIAKYAGFKLDE